MRLGLGDTVKLSFNPMPSNTVPESPIFIPRLLLYYSKRHMNFHVGESSVMIYEVIASSKAKSVNILRYLSIYIDCEIVRL